MRMAVATANLWNANPAVEPDLRRLMSDRLFAIGLNEAWPYSGLIDQLAAEHGYAAFGTQTEHPAEVILLPARVRGVTFEQRQTAYRAGGSQIPRWGIAARWTHRGVDFALLNVHLNTEAQAHDWRSPAALPSGELQSWADSMKRVTDWARELRRERRRVLVVGDLNWAYAPPAVGTWKWAPRRAFRRRARMRCQYHYDMPRRPRGDRRPVEYVFWHPRDFQYLGQSFVTPEHSDHPFQRVDLRVRR